MIALPCLLYSMDLTVLNLALPAISADLRPTSTQLLWIVDIYGFLVAGLLITMGALGDRIGRRRLLLIGAAGFGVASVLAAFSTSAEILIATRAALGIAGATLAPSTLSLIRNMFREPGERRFAIGVWITSYSAGGAIGPLVGGVLLEHFWWGSVFLAGVPVMALLLAVGPALLPEFRDPEAGRPDLASAALSLAAVLPVIYGIKRIAEGGAGWLPLLSILAGLAAGAVFVQRQHRLADPLIDLRLFRAPAFSVSLATYTLGTFVAFGSFLFIAQYLQRVLGLSPLRAGLWMLPFFVGWISGSMLAPLIARRLRPAFALSAGLVLAAGGFGLLTRVDGGSALPVLVTGSDRPDRRERAAGAGRGGVGDLGDRLRARRSARHRAPRQPRHRCIRPRGVDAGAAAHCGDQRRRRARHRDRRRGRAAASADRVTSASYAVVIITGAWSLVPTSARTAQLAARSAIVGEARM